ncbi:MarR family transcriptional regulator [Cellulomonas sp. APG4]|nr:MarR family transcriptional regulator [Cellulomonas sp. APG4]
MAPVTSDTNRAVPAPADEVRWLSAEQLRNWRDLMEMLSFLPAALDSQLKHDAGLNGFEYHVLAALSEAPGGELGLSTLAEMSRGSLSRLSHAVTRLERAGWVERRRLSDEAGRRGVAVLTEAGQAKLEETAPGHVREVRRLVVDVLTPEQLTSIAGSAREITAAILADPPAECTEGCVEPPDC